MPLVAGADGFQARADRLAAGEGDVRVLAAEDEQGFGRRTLKFAKPVATHDADARASLAALASHPACTGRLATLGVCLGGHLALGAAPPHAPNCRLRRHPPAVAVNLGREEPS